MSRNRVIGRDGKLPWDLPDEMQHFRETTLRHPIIMGRKTFESHGGRPLPNRQNIVLSSHPIKAESIDHAFNLNSALEIAELGGAKECFVIGGAAVYAEALLLADRLYETVVDAEIVGDVYFPIYNQNDWQETNKTHHRADVRHEFAFDITIYKRRKSV